MSSKDKIEVKIAEDKEKIQIKRFENDDYIFEYPEIKYLNKTTPQTEIYRHKEWSTLISDFCSYLKHNKITLKSSNKSLKDIVETNLSVWIFSNLLTELVLVDPLIPYKAKKNNVFISTLIHLGTNVHGHKLSPEEASSLFWGFDLIERCNSIALTINKMKNEKGKIEYKNDQLKYTSDSVNFNLYLSEDLYHKLRKRYKNKKDFHKWLFCLLLRYKTLGGKSHHFAMNTKFKDAIRSQYGVNMECFASPMNAHYDMYCSAFYDIEKYFGSYGNFYHLNFIKGFYIANPPYENWLLEKMVIKFEEAMKSKDELSISFGLPFWGKYEKFVPLEIAQKSKYKTYERCFAFGEVLWFSHEKKDGIKIPSHCRFVFQNTKGKKMWNISFFSEAVEKIWVS